MRTRTKIILGAFGSVTLVAGTCIPIKTSQHIESNKYSTIKTPPVKYANERGLNYLSDDDCFAQAYKWAEQSLRDNPQ